MNTGSRLAAALIAALDDGTLELLAKRLAPLLAGDPRETLEDRWMDTRAAADYAGVHRDTLRKAAARRCLPFEQTEPGCKLYFRRSDLDRWRRNGGLGPSIGAVE